MNVKINRTLRFISAAALVCLLATFACAAGSPKISPALDIIANELDFIKTGIVNNDITFSESDFKNALGVTKLGSITILTLPESASGMLLLNSTPVMPGQVISRKSLSSLRFSAPKGGTTSTSFSFSSPDCGVYERSCTLHVISEMNFAPTVSLVNNRALSLKTFKNITVYGTLKASDPEMDELTYCITEQPKRGVLVLTDKHYGDFYYTPAADYSGGDSFEYTVYDKYGNYSERVSLSISVINPESAVFYSDLDGHWAHNAAICVTQNGIMKGTPDGDSYLFDPDAPVSRAQFLVMAMNAAGFKVATPTSDTGFYDDDTISAQYKGYVAAALELDFISGVPEDEKLCFYPNNQITRAEAAVILNNIIGAELPTVKPVFADKSSLPAWAENALYALCEAGVINGTGCGSISPYSPLTRAETAQMLSAVLDLLA